MPAKLKATKPKVPKRPAGTGMKITKFQERQDQSRYLSNPRPESQEEWLRQRVPGSKMVKLTISA